MPAKRKPRAWTVWERWGDKWVQWDTRFTAKDRDEACSLAAAAHCVTPAYLQTHCHVLPAGQRPGRKKAKGAK